MNKSIYTILMGMLFCIPFSYAQKNEVDPDYAKMVKRICPEFDQIQAKDALLKVGKDNIYFLDTREEKEFKVSHIKGAIHVGYDKPLWLLINELPKDAEIIVYCSVGARSSRLGAKLKQKGYTNVKNLYGGLFLWANQLRPMVDSNDQDTDRIHGYSPSWGKWVKQGEVVY